MQGKYALALARAGMAAIWGRRTMAHLPIRLSSFLKMQGRGASLLRQASA
jgi:hypothetical protein